MPRKPATAAPYTLVTLACSALHVDAGIQPRLALNSEAVETYATLYQEAEGDEDPMRAPLDVFQIDGVYYVADGFHRLAAALQVSRETLPCHVYVGTRRDAMVHGAFANVRARVPYTYGDKQQVLERLLADPDIAQRGDRDLARDLGMTRMTVWRSRARLAEEARLQAEIAALPATATAPKVREQEQLAAYLGVPVDDIKDSIGTSSMRYGSPQEIIKDMANQKVLYNKTPQEAAEQVAKHVTHVAVVTTAPPQTPSRPKQSKAYVAARQAEERREALAITLERALERLVELYPFTPDACGMAADHPNFRLPPTVEELVAAVLPKDVEYMAGRLTQARTALEALCSAWETRMQETAASV